MIQGLPTAKTFQTPLPFLGQSFQNARHKFIEWPQSFFIEFDQTDPQSKLLSGTKKNPHDSKPISSRVPAKVAEPVGVVNDCDVPAWDDSQVFAYGFETCTTGFMTKQFFNSKPIYFFPYFFRRSLDHRLKTQRKSRKPRRRMIQPGTYVL